MACKRSGVRFSLAPQKKVPPPGGTFRVVRPSTPPHGLARSPPAACRLPPAVSRRTPWGVVRTRVSRSFPQPCHRSAGIPYPDRYFHGADLTGRPMAQSDARQRRRASQEGARNACARLRGALSLSRRHPGLCRSRRRRVEVTAWARTGGRATGAAAVPPSSATWSRSAVVTSTGARSAPGR